MFELLSLLVISLVTTDSILCKADSKQELQAKWGGDWSFSGISTYAHLPHVRCLTDPDEKYDIGIIGAPFDTAVSYRTGARFGPRAIRAASARQHAFRGFNPRANINPYSSWAKLLDCGDIPVTPFDNSLALRQMTEAFTELGSRKAKSSAQAFAKPRLIALGGDHFIALPELRALSKIHKQRIAVLHFDAHLDTWHPSAYPSVWLDPNIPIEEQQSAFTHGTQYWLAWKEGLIANNSVHAGLRTRLIDGGDNEYDDTQGWLRIPSDAISYDELGPKGVAKSIMDTIGTEKPVYLSVDIDVIDPGLAPATGTPEPAGWTTRELVQVLRGIEDLNVVGADIVEVSPPFDGPGEQTALAGAQVAYEILTNIVKRGAGASGSDGVFTGHEEL